MCIFVSLHLSNIIDSFASLGSFLKVLDPIIGRVFRSLFFGWLGPLSHDLDKFFEAAGPLFSLDNLLEKMLFVFYVLLIKRFLDTREDMGRFSAESSISIIYRSWTRLIFHEWFLS